MDREAIKIRKQAGRVIQREIN